VAWVTPTTCPAGLTQETFAARPDACGRRAVRSPLDPPGCRTRPVPRVPPRLEAAVSRVADLAARYRQRWQGATALAPLKTPRPRAVLHGNTVPGVRQDVTGFALVDHLGRLGMGPSATRQHLGVARLRCVDARRGLGTPSTRVP